MRLKGKWEGWRARDRRREREKGEGEWGERGRDLPLQKNDMGERQRSGVG